jgi:hypothetical protein
LSGAGAISGPPFRSEPWLARGRGPGERAGGAVEVVHLAAEEDDGLAILDPLAAGGTAALDPVHALSLPPG